MMTSLGHEVFLYAGTQNDAQVKELITVVDDETRARLFGHYDWNNQVFDQWDPQAECWRLMNVRAAIEIQKRREKGDFLCIIGGSCHAELLALVPGMQAVEWGIGYEGIIDNVPHVFESTPWMHYVYGARGIKDGRFFDTVIPNAFDPEDYVFSEKKDDYLLYLGRMTSRKGMAILRELVKRGHNLVTAGQGEERIEGALHMGVVRGEHKAKLLTKAKALLVPTTYIEPFGGVAIEAMFSGTPVITTDFGAFRETVGNANGIRCSTLGDFDRACEYVKELDPQVIQCSAQRFSTNTIKFQYDDYFRRVQLLENKGWYS